MSKSSFVAIAATASMIAAAACGDLPSGTDGLPAFAVTNTGFVDFNFTTFDECNGEWVDFETKFKLIFNTTFDEAGGIHLGFHRAWHGTGVGQVTGTVYNLNWPWEQQFYSRGPWPEVFTRTVNNNLESRGSAPNRIFRVTNHITVNANGDATADVSNSILKCVG